MSSLENKIKSLFASNNVHIEPIELDYENTNDIFEVAADEGNFIVKIPKDVYNTHSTFWIGLEYLFGFNLNESIKNQQCISDYVKQYGSIEVPKIYKVDATSNNLIGKPFVILEKMDGEPVLKGSNLEQQVMKKSDFIYQLGVHLGSLHLQNLDYFGTLNQKQYSLEEFPAKLSATISKLGKDRRALEDLGVQQLLPIYVEQAMEMQVPAYSALIMPDLWPSQFLATEEYLSACIDIEAYIVGPIALELTLIELWIGPLGKFKEGYFSVNNYWPTEIENNRELYRFFLFLLYGCPEAGLDACIYSRAKFPQGARVKARISAPRLRPPGYPGWN